MTDFIVFKVRLKSSLLLRKQIIFYFKSLFCNNRPMMLQLFFLCVKKLDSYQTVKKNNLSRFDHQLFFVLC